jgi:hypothetical protein
LPKSPSKLKVLIFEVNEGFSKTSDKYEIKNVLVQKLAKKQFIIDSDTKEFLDFAQEFSLKAGYLNPGNYYSKNRKFQIRYFDNIEDKSNTPSRIHKQTGIIDVSKKWFDGMPVPCRVAIITHEFSHNHLQDDKLESNDEIEQNADENGLVLYQGLGYPKVEWMYAWDHIFKNHPSHIARLDNMDAKLRDMQ